MPRGHALAMLSAPAMAPDEDEFDDFDDGGGERFSELVEDETLDYEDSENDGGTSHSESVYIVDDEEAGRESYARNTTATLDLVAEQIAFQDDVVEETLDADPEAIDAAFTAPDVEPGEPARDEAARRHLRGMLEALLFVSERPMKAADLADISRAEIKEVRSVLEELSESYRAESRGFQLDELAGGWQLRTSAAYAPFVRELTQAKPVRLSRAQVETLAIIAYRQPITRPEIEDIRGVDAGAVLKLLLDRDMVRVLGKKDEPGRPLLYGTTGHFLTFFGLKSLKDLPTLREFTELTDESREVVERELGEVLPEGPREPPPHVAPPADEVIHAGEPAQHGQPEVLKTDEEAAEELRNAEAPNEEDEVERAEAETAAANDVAESGEEEDREEEESESNSEQDEGGDDSDSEDEEESGSGDAPAGGSNYDPSDEELYPDDDDEDFDDDDDDDDDDEDDEEEDEDE